MDFKHILWVEDKAGGEGLGASIIHLPGFNKTDKTLDNTFGKYASEVKICSFFEKAIKIICSNEIYNYDCVILDLDLTASNDSVISYDILESFGIDIENIPLNDVYQNGGYYLYLLLLNRSFPLERIRILSAHGGEDEEIARKQSELVDKFKEAGIMSPKSIGANKHEDISPKIDEMYTLDGNSYYKFRSFVFYICETCKKFISKTKNINEVSFNHYVYGDDKKLDDDSLISLLNNVKMQLPLMKINNEDELSKRYKNILRYLSEHFHANYNNDYRCEKEQVMCWKIVTLMRNWMAHGKLKDDKLNKINFIILFLLSIRTIFGNLKVHRKRDSKYYEEYQLYKKTLGQSPNGKDQSSEFGKLLVNQWQECSYEAEIFEELKRMLENRNTAFISSANIQKDVLKQFIYLYQEFDKYTIKDTLLSSSYINMLEKLGGPYTHNFQGTYDMFLKAICLYPTEIADISIKTDKMIIDMNLNDQIQDEIQGRNEIYDFIKDLRKVSLYYLNNNTYDKKYV